MTLLFLSLGIGFLLSKIITDSIRNKYNINNHDVFIYNKKQFFSIFEDLKKRNFSSKPAKQSIANRRGLFTSLRVRPSGLEPETY